MTNAKIIKGKRTGFRSASVAVWPDNTMTRADIRSDLAVRLRSIADAAKVVGMTRSEFIAARDCVCSRSTCTYDADAGCGLGQ